MKKNNRRKYLLKSFNPLSYYQDKLPGLGGFYNSFNLNLYNFTFQNPMRYVDPDGTRSSWFEEFCELTVGSLVGLCSLVTVVLPFFVPQANYLHLILGSEHATLALWLNFAINPTVWGYIIGLIDITINDQADVEVDCFSGVTIRKSNILPPTGGVSLGSVRFVGTAIPKEHFVEQHERGHTWQAIIFGPFYWILVALPSLGSYYRKAGDPEWPYPEGWATWWGGDSDWFWD